WIEFRHIVSPTHKYNPYPFETTSSIRSSSSFQIIYDSLILLVYHFPIEIQEPGKHCQVFSFGKVRTGGRKENLVFLFDMPGVKIHECAQTTCNISNGRCVTISIACVCLD